KKTQYTTVINYNNIVYTKIDDVDKYGWDYKMGYVFLFLIGFGLTVSGGAILIAYMYFLPAGVTWIEYFIFIQGRVEAYFFPIGLLIISIVTYHFPNKS